MRASRLSSVLLAVSLLASCSRSPEPPPPQAAPETPAGSPTAPSGVAAVVSAFGGSPSFGSAQSRKALELGAVVVPGDTLVADASSWIDLAVGVSPDAGSASFAVIRVQPGTVCSLRMLDGGDGSGGEPRVTEVGLESGSIAVKAGKLSRGDEFVVVTPNSAASVRGTAFSVESRAGLTLVAVRHGAVAVLPKGPLLEGLLDGRIANPVAGAVVRTAFAFAPTARAGEELRVGADASAAEEAYGALLVGAERARSNGFDLEAADDPSGFIASPGSDAERKLREAFSAYRPAPLSAEAERALAALLAMRDPALGYEAAPAAFSERPDGGSSKAPLKSSALAWSKKISPLAFADALTRVGGLVVAVDGAGTVFALDGEGAVRWKEKLGALAVTALQSTLAVASPEALIVLDGESGAERGRYRYGFTASSPSAKPVAVPEGLAVATPRGIALLRAENAALVREILIEGGLAAPPVLAERELVCVTGGGSLVFIDLSSGAVSEPVPVSLTQGAFSPRYRAGVVAAADRSGRVVVVEAAERVLRWSREIGARVGSEPELGDGRLFIWTADRKLLSLSVADGSDAAPAVAGVSSPPLLSGGSLYWGDSSGALVVADAATGRVRKRVPIAESCSVRPIIVSGVLYAGTSNGRLVKVELSK